ncbi:MAG: hypothetical protein CL678_01280 [Bdellovibrionaceae bacterium]|nr:hypothetical protein [Pseudobdellovibrionaceae bacterium]|tara:strand:+ start:1080 stop:1853 length:774 start_codon:yes stop_codon:yes gene_type:complete
MATHSGVTLARDVSTDIMRNQQIIQQALVDTSSIMHIWSDNPVSAPNRERFDEHGVRMQLASELGRVLDSVVGQIASKAAKARYKDCRVRFDRVSKAYAKLISHGMTYTDVADSCVRNPGAEMEAMNFIGMGLNPRELDVYAYARDNGLSYADAVAVLLRNRADGIEAIELDGTVYTIADPTARTTFDLVCDVESLLKNPLKDRDWKWRWKELLCKQHPTLKYTSFQLEFTEEQPTALDVLISPTPLVMLVWKADGE